MKYRPTSLRIYSESCPYSLKLFTEQEKAQVSHATGQERLDSYSNAEQECEGPALRDIGIIFHACIHAAALAEKEGKPRIAAVEATALVLTKRFGLERVIAGLEMAQEFIFTWEFDTRLNYEHGLAFNAKWQAVEWDSPDRRLRMVMDSYGIVEIDDPEMGEIKLARADDYKTGWAVSDDMLDGIQALCHSTALFNLHKDDADGVLVQIVSTRRHKTYRKQWMFDNEDDLADLRNRQRKIEFIMQAADVTDFQPRIGYGCAKCNFTKECNAFQERVKSAMATDAKLIAQPVEAAKDYIVMKTRAKEVEGVLKEMCKGGAIELDGGSLGYFASSKRMLNDDAIRKVVDMWLDKAGPKSPDDFAAVVRGLLVAMDPGVTQVDNLLKKLARPLGYPTQKACLAAEGEKLTTKDVRATFKFDKEAAETE